MDRFPRDDAETGELFAGLDACEAGTLPNGWGEVSHWPAEQIAAGDWTATVWRSPQLAAASTELAERIGLAALSDTHTHTHLQDRPDAQRRLPEAAKREQVTVHATLQTLYADYRKTEAGVSTS